MTSSKAKTTKQDFQIHEKSRKHDTSKRTKFSSLTGSKEMEICDLPDKDFKTVVLRKFVRHKKTQKYSSTKSEKKIHTKKKFNRETEIIEKNQTNSGVEDHNK